MKLALAEILHGHLTKQGWSFERLAEEAGLPRNTVYRWTRGEVKRVRHWQDLARAARALALNTSQANALLAVGGHPPIDVLLKQARNREDRELLARWISTSTNNLPAQLTSFVGREEELMQLTRLISSTRLITLTGPGGAGKTRLALEAAQEVLEDFEEVAFVDLAPLRDPALVVPAISKALELKETPDEPPFETLRTYLRNRRALLVLDTFAHVMDAASLVSQILSASRWVKVLVTSRRRLNVRGEHEFMVPPFSLPGIDSGVEILTKHPAVALFVDRARIANPTFAITPRTAPLVAKICTHLDGLPLGIELAAARTRQIPLGSMLERFPGRLMLASGGPRDLPERQRTLQATIAWSYALLAPDEQALLACLAALPGRFTEEVAEQNSSAMEGHGRHISEMIESLVEHNVLRRVWDNDNEPRYDMMETIREYVLERRHTGVAPDGTRAGSSGSVPTSGIENQDAEG